MPKPIFLAILLAASLLMGGVARAADPTFPALIGTWSTKSEGAVMVWGKDPGAKTHWKVGQTTLVGEIVITKQEGRVVQGTFKTAKTSEPFVGAFGHDGKTIYFADTDGFFDARIVDADTIEMVYRHATPKSAVVSVGTWTRKK
jgi:hypothetical protein